MWIWFWNNKGHSWQEIPKVVWIYSKRPLLPTIVWISSLSSFWHQQDPLPWVYQQILLQWPKIIVPKTIMPGKKLKFDFTVQNNLITLLLLQIRFWFRVFFYVLLFLVENLLQPKRKSYWLLLGMIIVSNFGWLIQVSFYFEIVFIFYF